MDREKGKTLMIKKLTDGWLLTEGKENTSMPGNMVKRERAAETALTAAKMALLWLGFDLPRVEEALPVLTRKVGKVGGSSY